MEMMNVIAEVASAIKSMSSPATKLIFFSRNHAVVNRLCFCFLEFNLLFVLFVRFTVLPYWMGYIRPASTLTLLVTFGNESRRSNVITEGGPVI